MLLTACALALGSCTSATGPASPTSPPSPTPSTTATSAEAQDGAPSVAVVLPARAARSVEQIDEQRRAVERIAAIARGDDVISSVRTVVPDRSTTVGDVVEMLAEEGHDLVCALGPGAARAVRDAALRFPGTRFCGAPGNLPDVPSNALVFDLRVEESAYLAGIAAGEAAGLVGADAGSTPAIIVGDASQASRLQLAFDQGFSISTAAGDPTPVRVATSPAAALDAADALYGSGTFLVFASAGRIELGVLQAARSRDRLVIATLPPGPPEEPSEAEATPAEVDETVLLFLGDDLSAAFRDTMDELRAGWRGGVRSIGFRNGALTLTPGTSSIWSRISDQVLRTRDALIAGTDLQIVGGA